MFRTKKFLTLALLILYISLCISCKKGEVCAFSKESSPHTIDIPRIYLSLKDYVYYISLNDGYIYKIDRLNKKRSLVLNQKAYESGMLYDNDWIYYVNSSNENLFYRVNLKSGVNQKLSTYPILEDKFLKYDGSIYYFDCNNDLYVLDDNGMPGIINDYLRLSVISRMGFNSTILNNELINWDFDGIERMDVESGEDFNIINEEIYPIVQTDGKWIYYISFDDLKLYRIDVNGNGKQRVCEHMVIDEGSDYDCGNVVLYKGLIYHTVFSKDRGLDLYCINLEEGTDKKVIEGVMHFIIKDDNIYYMDSSDNGKLFVKEIYNDKSKELAKGDMLPYIDVYKDMVFYMEKSISTEDSIYGGMFLYDMIDKTKIELK